MKEEWTEELSDAVEFKLSSVISLLSVLLEDQLEQNWLEKCVDWKMVKFKIAKPYRRSLRMWAKWLWGIDVFFQERWPLGKILLLVNAVVTIIICLVLRGQR